MCKADRSSHSISRNQSIDQCITYLGRLGLLGRLVHQDRLGRLVRLGRLDRLVRLMGFRLMARPRMMARLQQRSACISIDHNMPTAFQ